MPDNKDKATGWTGVPKPVSVRLSGSYTISCWQYLLLKNFEVVSLEDPVVGQMQGRQSRGLLCQVADQLEVEVSVEEDEAADLKFSEDKK
jgi:hypothetical protein